MRRLDQDALAALPPTVRRPGYDRAGLAIGMAHLGVGAFHRCHQAEYTDDMLEARPGPWGTVGVNLRPPRIAPLLEPQDGLYTRTLTDGARRETRVIGAIRRVIDVADAPSGEAALAALADPAVRVVTMTVTEKGYCHVPAGGEPDWSNPELARDHDGAWPPATMPGLLAAALERRRSAGAPPVTLISCDNVPANGALLRTVLLAFAAARSAGLADWIGANAAFPSTMVDRIAPAPTPEDVETASAAIGFRDEAAVVGEPFRQWVIEDRFAGPRPPWDLAGAQFVADASAYELTKMRVLNAAQSTLSHLGALLGLEFSFEAVADPTLRTLVRRMLERETAATLPPAPGMAAGAYIDSSLARIANPAIRHRCHQIATDGSQKIVQRLVNPLRERLAAGAPPGLLALAVASWLAYALSGAQRFGARWSADDPWGPRVAAVGEAAGGDFATLAKALLGIQAIFGADLAASPAAPAVAGHLRGLLAGRPREYLASLLRKGMAE